MIVDALSAGQAKNLAVGAIVVVVVVGLIVGLAINAIVGKIITAVVVVVLGVVLWTQRSSIENRVKNCDASASLLGLHVSLNSSQRAQCQSQVNR
jgi:hypothetical protein